LFGIKMLIASSGAAMGGERLMPARRRQDLVAALSKRKVLRIRAGRGEHRFISIWIVVVDDRVFVRSWSMKPEGWYRTFLHQPSGAIQVAGEEIAVGAVPIKDKRLRDAIDRAYLEKYKSKGSLKYAKDLCSPKSRATTLELVLKN
jgi:hypothetical protein